jgi:hypothetical protein
LSLFTKTLFSTPLRAPDTILLFTGFFLLFLGGFIGRMPEGWVMALALCVQAVAGCLYLMQLQRDWALPHLAFFRPRSLFFVENRFKSNTR